MIKLDDTHLAKNFSITQLHSLFKEREAIKRTFKLKGNTQELSFLNLPKETDIKNIYKLVSQMKKTSKTLLLIGIGGSSTGSKAAIEALGGKNVVFLENPNPATAKQILLNINLKKTSVNVISKSGTTLETLALFFTVLERMQKVNSPSELKKRIFVTTSDKNNFLKRFAKQNNFTHIPISAHVSGRYSVLSSVGLLPMAFSGINIHQLRDGAAWVSKNRREAYLHGALAYGAHRLLNRPLSVLFFYDERLRLFGEWYRQLWAESLAKSETSGPTPIMAIGTMAQHSLLQLFLHGPADKWFTMIEIGDYKSDLRLPQTLLKKSIPSPYSFLSNVPLERIIKTQQFVTEQSLLRYHNPLCKLTIPSLSASSLGALFQYFQLLTASTGTFYHINPFTQPAVEHGKTAVLERLQNNSV